MSNDNLPAIQDWSPKITDRIEFVYDGETYVIENMRLYNAEHHVAVVYSPGYGGGWSTWQDDVDPTDARVAVLTLTGASATLMFNRYGSESPVRFKDRRFYAYVDSSMYDELAICWLPAGTLYKIEEYDGAESVLTNYDSIWHIA